MRLLFEIDKKNYDPAGWSYSRPSARALILKDGLLSVIHSRRYGYCKIPGGGIEPGEDPTEAMMREVKEETGLTVIPESVREFGYVHRIEKGGHEPIFIQDNFYYICDVLPGQAEAAYTENEREDEFAPEWLSFDEALRLNEAYCALNPDNSMIERELRVMKLFRDEINTDTQ